MDAVREDMKEKKTGLDGGFAVATPEGESRKENEEVFKTVQV